MRNILWIIFVLIAMSMPVSTKAADPCDVAQLVNLMIVDPEAIHDSTVTAIVAREGFYIIGYRPQVEGRTMIEVTVGDQGSFYLIQDRGLDGKIDAVLDITKARHHMDDAPKIKLDRDTRAYWQNIYDQTIARALTSYMLR